MTGIPMMTAHKGRFFLTISVILNLFFIAMVGGYLGLGYVRSHALQTKMFPGLAMAEAQLSSKDAAAFDAVMRRDAPRYMAQAKKLRDVRIHMEQLLLAEPYDPVKIKAAMQQWQSTSDDFTHAISGTLIEALGKISPEGRRKLIDWQRKRKAIGDKLN